MSGRLGPVASCMTGPAGAGCDFLRARICGILAVPCIGRIGFAQPSIGSFGEFCMRRAIVFLILVVCLATLGDVPARSAKGRPTINGIENEFSSASVMLRTIGSQSLADRKSVV